MWAAREGASEVDKWSREANDGVEDTQEGDEKDELARSYNPITPIRRSDNCLIYVTVAKMNLMNLLKQIRRIAKKKVVEDVEDKKEVLSW